LRHLPALLLFDQSANQVDGAVQAQFRHVQHQIVVNRLIIVRAVKKLHHFQPPLALLDDRLACFVMGKAIMSLHKFYAVGFIGEQKDMYDVFSVLQDKLGSPA
jgi:hypothetical protein